MIEPSSMKVVLFVGGGIRGEIKRGAKFRYVERFLVNVRFPFVVFDTK